MEESKYTVSETDDSVSYSSSGSYTPKNKFNHRLSNCIEEE